ncbi:hypothetical protein K432DRAFT_55030 [Lepidopterella palustris CBS 459.81]|uniref:Uncharacterized protein n=1 Tax=Lepidopterella palustris CBS 459.81 TaxID=1314670 RepID=A0A8E2E9M7_9PEZI|nr:hypothetical protein K432DRAFT_55030 [Lepidopterella palustris CBS 459.81]
MCVSPAVYCNEFDRLQAEAILKSTLTVATATYTNLLESERRIELDHQDHHCSDHSYVSISSLPLSPLPRMHAFELGVYVGCALVFLVVGRYPVGSTSRLSLYHSRHNVKADGVLRWIS